MTQRFTFPSNTSYPLINRDQYYSIERKLISIHSCDRDKCRWPESNHFEVRLPESITNIQSVRLAEIYLPINYYTFSNNTQNTKFVFTLKDRDPEVDWSGNIQDIKFEVTIDEGFYTNIEVASELQYKMNLAVQNYIRESINAPNFSFYENFSVFYDERSMKFTFINSVDDFSLKFAYKLDYDLSNCEQSSQYDKDSKWGLPWNLGFDKENYDSIKFPSDVSGVKLDPSGGMIYIGGSQRNDVIGFPPKYFANEDDIINNPSQDPRGSFDVSGVVRFITAPNKLRIMGERVIYMEMENFNNMIELDPHINTSNGKSNYEYTGKVNAAFAKIPIYATPYSEQYGSLQDSLQNIVTFDPVMERVSKLKFKFRYHDGRLVNFQDFPLSFTLEFNRFQNEVPKHYNLRIPPVLQGQG